MGRISGGTRLDRSSFDSDDRICGWQAAPAITGVTKAMTRRFSVRPRMARFLFWFLVYLLMVHPHWYGWRYYELGIFGYFGFGTWPTRIHFNVWAILANLVLITAAAYFLGRRMKPARYPWQCRRCGYDLRGSAQSSACRECGRPMDPGTPSSSKWRRLWRGW